MSDVQTVAELQTIPDVHIAPRSLVANDGVQYGLAQLADGPHLAVLAPADAPVLNEFEGDRTTHSDQ